MSKEHSHITNDVLAKYFAGEATHAESEAVKGWASFSEENADELTQQKMLWEDLGAVMMDERAEAKVFDTDTAWKNVKAIREATVTKNSFRWSPMRIAASVLLLTGLGVLARMYFAAPPMMEVASAVEVKNVDLPDGSHITLNKETTIQYPEEFSKDSRMVTLKGEAFFDVQPDPEKPFIIQAGAATVTVLGTSFNVRTSADTVAVVVETGKVLFSAGAKEIILTEGQKATYTTQSGLLASTNSATITGVDQFWRTKKLTFSGQSLTEVITALEAAYFVDIEFENTAIANCRLSVNFENDSLENILDVVALTLDLQVSKTEGIILLSGKGCAEN